MKKIILKAVLCLSMFICFANSASAFIFSDVAALSQRAAKFLKDKQDWVKTTAHYSEMMEHIKTFQEHKRQFDSFHNNFSRVYRKIESGRYLKDFDITKWDWTKLDDHILRMWRSFDQASWDMQKLMLSHGRLYQTNSIYRNYADKLFEIIEDKITFLKAQDALRTAHQDRIKEYSSELDKLKDTNKSLSSEDNNGAALQSLNNQIMLLQTLIANEQNRMAEVEKNIAVEEDRLKTRIQNAYKEAQSGSTKDVEHVLSFDKMFGKLRNQDVESFKATID